MTDVYSTDGELIRYELTVLQDELNYFPRYYAAPLVQQTLPQGARDVLSVLANVISDEAMQKLNASVVFEGKSFAQVASGFLSISPRQFGFFL